MGRRNSLSTDDLASLDTRHSCDEQNRQREGLARDPARRRKRGVLKGIREKDDKGVFTGIVYYVSDSPGKVKTSAEQHEQRIAATAQEIAGRMDASPRAGNRHVDVPSASDPRAASPRAALRHAAEGPPIKERLLKTNESKKEISLSPDASASDAAGERENAFGLFEQKFEELWQAAPWSTDGKLPAKATARTAFARLSPEKQDLALKAAGFQREIYRGRNQSNGRPADARGHSKKLHDWLNGGHFENFESDVRKLVEREAAAEAAEAERLKRLEAELAATRIEVEEACRYHADSIIRQLCEYLNPRRHATGMTTEGFRRGEWWGLKGPKPDQPGCLYPPEIIREAQRQNNEAVISENGQSATVENLVNIHAGLRKWDAVRFGPPIGDPGCLLDPAIIEDVISRSRKAA